MAGLLDFVATPEGQGLLSAAFGGLAGARRGQPLNSIGRAGLAGLAGYSQAQDRIGEAETRAQNNELRQMQVGQYKRQMSEAEAAAAEKARIDGLLRNAYAPVSGTDANARTGIVGPRPEAAEAIGSTPQINFQQLLAQGVPFARVKELADSQTLGRTKVARTVKGIGPDGREYEYQVDEFGQRVGDGLAQYRAPIQADTGGAVQFLDPYTQKPVSSLTKTMSPGEKASNALGWANNAVARQRLALDQNGYTFNADLGGYVPKAPDGQFVPLQGGPSAGEVKLTEGESKGTLYLGQMRSATNVLNQLTNDGKDASPTSVAAAGSIWARPFSSQSAQQIAQAQNQWSEAFLRAKTGAAATPGEVELNNKTFFPQIGEGPDVIEQKRLARLQAERDMEAAAGRGKSRIPAVTPIKNKGADLKGVPADIANILNQY